MLVVEYNIMFEIPEKLIQTGFIFVKSDCTGKSA